MVGQFWYVAVGTLGFGLIGIISMSHHIAPTSGGGLRNRMARVGTDARRLTIVFLLLSAVSVLLISSYFFLRAKGGSEGYIVGRHNDSFVPIWTAARGIPARGARPQPGAVRHTGVGRGHRAGSGDGVGVGRTPPGLFTYSNFRAPAVFFYASTQIGVVPSGTAVAVGMLLMIAALVATRGRPGVLVSIACGWMMVAVASTIETDRYFDDYDMPAQFAQLTFVFAPIPGVDLERFGARLILIDDGVRQGLGAPYAMGLWVMPGPELDQYRLNGQVLPTPDPAGE